MVIAIHIRISNTLDCRSSQPGYSPPLDPTPHRGNSWLGDVDRIILLHTLLQSPFIPGSWDIWFWPGDIGARSRKHTLQILNVSMILHVNICHCEIGLHYVVHGSRCWCRFHCTIRIFIAIMEPCQSDDNFRNDALDDDWQEEQPQSNRIFNISITNYYLS